MVTCLSVFSFTQVYFKVFSPSAVMRAGIFVRRLHQIDARRFKCTHVLAASYVFTVSPWFPSAWLNDLCNAVSARTLSAALYDAGYAKKTTRYAKKV